MTPTSVLLLGLLLGFRHATDPDHVVAMGTIVTRDPHLRRAASTGVLWGIGHTLTVLVVGSAMLLGHVHVPEAAVHAMDLAVASMLVALGLVALRTRSLDAAAAPSLGERVLVSPLRPLVVGIVHGLAGSAAMTLVALATIREERDSLVYLALFGVGTVLGMVGITMMLALSLRWLGTRSTVVPLWIARASGALSIVAGLVVALGALSS